MRKNHDLGLLILRITIGVLMLLHGIPKLSAGLDFIKSMLVEKGLPGFIAYGVLIGEILAPIAILIGFRTRIAAAIYALNCVVAKSSETGDRSSCARHVACVSAV